MYQYEPVAILRDGDSSWALVEDPDGTEHIVMIGDYLGKYWGRVTTITSESLVVTEEAFRWDAENRRRVASNNKIERRLGRLTPGETQVLRMVTAGKPNKAMAVELNLSVRTIEVRRAKIMEKMQAESIAELVHMTLAVRDSSGKRQPSFGANRATDGTRMKHGSNRSDSE